MRLLWLPDVLREAGLTVHTVPGWQTRGSDSWGPIRGLTCHATAGGRGARAADEIAVLLNGSPSAPPPIAQLYLARNGDWHVVASGRCNHSLIGWAGPNKGLGNPSLLGIEAGNDNRGEPWPTPQLRSYERGVAALCRHLEMPASRAAGHKEHQPWPPPPGQTSTKSDPVGIDMGQFRAAVAALIEGGDDEMAWNEQLPVPKWMMDLYGSADGWDDGKIAAQGAVISGYGHSRQTNDRTKVMQTEQRAGFAAVLAAVAGEDVAAAAAAAARAAVREEFATLGPALAAELDGVSVEQITEALSRLRLVDAG